MMPRLFVPAILVALGYLAFFSVRVDLKAETKKIVPSTLATSSAVVDVSVATPKPIIQTARKGLKVPILTYHYVGNNPNPEDTARDYLSVTPDHFDLQLNWLSQNGYTPITLNDLYSNFNSNASLPQKPVILTFDDGYIDFYYNAWPILQKYNFKATSYIPTGLVGKDSYMNWEMIKQIHQSGLVDFESHGVSHRKLTSLPIDEIKTEVIESKKILEEKLDKQVNHFCYPYGNFNDIVISQLGNAGYLTAVSTINGINQSSSNIYSLFRIKIDNAYLGSLFEQKINY